MAESAAKAELPYIEVDLDVDPLQADRQLQLALHLNASRSELSSPAQSRKHSRSSSFDDDYFDSDVSGRFDDADEIDHDSPLRNPNNKSPSVHSAKRRRSNDWPNQQQQQEKGKSNQNRWHIYPQSNRKSSYNGSPRAAAASCRNGLQDSRPRRSRFVEAKMNDSVSEKPPSIFFPDEDKPAGQGLSQRHSGIFRFGKAIASAFNPFGVWGNVSDIWKGGGHEGQQEEDDRVRIERAYAELKSAGYKGTIKGNYLQQRQSGANNLPEQTWKSIQDKMNYKPSVGHLRQNSNESSFRSSLDLRKAKSSLGLTSSHKRDGSSSLVRQSEDSEFGGVRKQKSRRDMLRQEKLLKKVSNLEDKLNRARRELRDLRCPDKVPERSMCMDHTQPKPYTRKFVPGALPTLPSERFLEEQLALTESPEAAPALPSAGLENQLMIESSGKESDEGNIKKQASVKPKSSKESKASLTTDSPYRKRKSPDPESVSKTGNKEPLPIDEPGRPTSSASKSRKFAKLGASDSPGSVERKQSRDRLMEESDTSPEKKSQYLKPPGSRSPSLSPRKSSNATPTPCLRMKKGSANLRSSSVGIDESSDVENHQNEAQNLFYLHGQLQLDPDQSRSLNATPSPSPSPTRRREYIDDIPPVPPLPKDLAATAAKVDRRLAREIEKRKQTHQRKVKSQPKLQAQSDETFQWPDDIF